MKTDSATPNTFLSLTNSVHPTLRAVCGSVLMAALIFFAPSASEAADFSGRLKGVALTDALSANKAPSATFTYTTAGNIVTFNAGQSADADGTVVQYTWDFGDGTTGTGAQVQHTYSAKTPLPVTLTVIDNSDGVALAQESIVFSDPVNTAINFQPDGAAIPAGYRVDSGTPFSETVGYGWTSGPQSLGTRDRNSSLSPNQAYDTLIHVAPTAVWEHALPNGTYKVTICIGDPLAPDTSNTVMMENSLVIDHLPLSTSKRWIEKTVLVPVADGRLTLKFTGSSPYAKLCWLKIATQ